MRVFPVLLVFSVGLPGPFAINIFFLPCTGQLFLFVLVSRRYSHSPQCLHLLLLCFPLSSRCGTLALCFPFSLFVGHTFSLHAHPFPNGCYCVSHGRALARICHNCSLKHANRRLSHFRNHFLRVASLLITNARPQRERQRARDTQHHPSLFSYALTFEHPKNKKDKEGLEGGTRPYESHPWAGQKESVLSVTPPSCARSLSSYRQAHVAPLSSSLAVPPALCLLYTIAQSPCCL